MVKKLLIAPIRCAHPSIPLQLTPEVCERIAHIYCRGEVEPLASPTQRKRYARTPIELLQSAPENVEPRILRILTDILRGCREVRWNVHSANICREEVGIRGGPHAREYVEICAALLLCSVDTAVICSGRTFTADRLIRVMRRRRINVDTNILWRGSNTEVYEVRKE